MSRAQEGVRRAERLGRDASAIGVDVAVSAEIEERVDPVVPELEPGSGGDVAGEEPERDVGSRTYRTQQRQHPRQQPSAAGDERTLQPLQIALLEPSPRPGAVVDSVPREDLPDDCPVAAPRKRDVAFELLDVEIRAERLGERRPPGALGAEQRRIDVEQGHVHVLPTVQLRRNASILRDRRAQGDELPV